MRFFLISVLLTILWISCYKRVEGCLDPYSSNFNPLADDECAECCTNPKLNINLRHRFQDTFYNAADTGYTDAGQLYKLLDFSYYLSYFRVSSATGNVLKTENTIPLYYNQQWANEEVNAIIVRPGSFDYSINEIRTFGTFDSIRFCIGLPIQIRNADSIDVASTHILSDSLFLKNEAGEKMWARLLIAKGDMFSDTLSIEFSLSDPEVKVGLSQMNENVIGGDLNLKILADYALWFRNVDFTASQEQVKSTILSNLKDAFFVE